MCHDSTSVEQCYNYCNFLILTTKHASRHASLRLPALVSPSISLPSSASHRKLFTDFKQVLRAYALFMCWLEVAEPFAPAH